MSCLKRIAPKLKRIGPEPKSKSNSKALTIRKNGRPSKYDSKFCLMLLDHMREGGSFGTFCVKANVSDTTVENWVNEFPEFLGAKRDGVKLSLAWWEERGRQLAMGEGPEKLLSRKVVTTNTPVKVLVEGEGRGRRYKTVMEESVTVTETFGAAKGSTGAWVFNMVNRFPNEWKQRHEAMDGTPPPPVNPLDWTQIDDTKLKLLYEISLKARQPRVVN